MNNVTVRQFEHLQHSLDTRRPLITVSNHDATLDDPLLFGILSTHHLEPERMRWSLGAKEICFTNPLFNWFFSAGQVLPTVRGSGIHQSAIDEAIGLLNKNKWIHIFSEAKVNNNPQELLPFRWGIARLVLESKEPPIVVPFYHRGMEDIVLKTGFYKGPRIGVLVHVRQETRHSLWTTYRFWPSRSFQDEILCAWLG
ncbi:endocardial fibroelastosis 2 [Gorgonomyces haynaldii]|nr:endocardial fibroelastosis 2 [Gorgonomyces haynaldii]